MKEFSIIVAMDKNRGIGKAGQLPWHLSADMKYFKETTLAANRGKKNAVIMGRKTWQSIPDRFRPLAGRVNAVLTRNHDVVLPKGCFQFSDISEALDALSCNGDLEQIFVIGGASLYAQTINLLQCQKLYITRIDDVFDCDVFFPKIPQGFVPSFESGKFFENGCSFSFLQYEKRL